jgi:hypothetical protein
MGVFAELKESNRFDGEKLCYEKVQISWKVEIQE